MSLVGKDAFLTTELIRISKRFSIIKWDFKKKKRNKTKGERRKNES